MKKVIAAALFALIAAVGIAHAETDLDEPDYQEMDRLHTKIVRMKKEMDRLMKDVISTYPEQGGMGLADFGEDVKIDIVEDGKTMTVRADLPGMEKDKIDIALENEKTLRIAGAREVFKKETGPGVVRQERMSGRFERAIELPAKGAANGITATYKNGVLEIVVPKKAEAKEEKVKIQVQ